MFAIPAADADCHLSGRRANYNVEQHVEQRAVLHGVGYERGDEPEGVSESWEVSNGTSATTLETYQLSRASNILADQKIILTASLFHDVFRELRVMMRRDAGLELRHFCQITPLDHLSDFVQPRDGRRLFMRNL